MQDLNVGVIFRNLDIVRNLPSPQRQRTSDKWHSTLQAMFRNPRENANPSLETPLKPSVGRPPSPDGTTRSATMTTHNPPKPLTPRPNSKSNLPVLGKGQTANKKPSSAKTPGKPNASILSFFKKVDSQLKDDSIFLSQGTNGILPKPKALSPEILDSQDDLYNLYGEDEELARFNETEGSVKRRKTSGQSTPSAIGNDDGDLPKDMPMAAADMPAQVKNECSPPPEPGSKPKTKPKKPRRKGPFLSDSESDYEVGNSKIQETAVNAEKRQLRSAVAEQPKEVNYVVNMNPIDEDDIHENKPIVPEVDSVLPADSLAWKRPKRVPVADAQAKWDALQPKTSSPKQSESPPSEPPKISDDTSKNPTQIPTLKKEATSIDEWGNFEDFDEFPDDDEFGEGEEAVERKWMEEQARLEAVELGEDEESFNGFDDDPIAEDFVPIEQPDESMTAACPICEASLAGISPDDATRHVNGCLDGNPIPLPAPVKKEPAEVKFMPPEAKNRFARKAAIARPGQVNPIQLGGSSSAAPSSAFSKLMSGHAEDAAWANAAAAEAKSRGKPAYQRTCPFYKIMPGFFICVDAFRYGAVQGCNAYFLSHFHSDHYVGLTSTWCHGPIYCSKVTANLVKQQLKVDPKYVIPLRFEERVEVPGTQGVAVTMIPANHCPGSSLFLFEKVVGKGSNPKVQRVLHCGDFRACPAHIAHPLLMPDIVDSITGKTKQQKIDVCYLDTTYLNPRYAFPSQEEVIKACADMCVSLRKERAEESDAWEVVKRERAGTGMAKFVNSAIKAEDDSIAMSLATNSSKPRGRLLVICGTYSIGKERICLGIARALDCKIWAPPGKQRICAALEDEELMSRMTEDPKEAQIHMQMLMEIRPETLQDYLNSYKPHFSRIVGFRPSGWNYKPPNSRFTDSPSIPTILHSVNWKSSFSMAELVPQRGSTREASCFGVPYSEHSSFRELTMFVCALRIEKVVPTVNVGSATGRSKMKSWIERWLVERRKTGCLKLGEGEGEVRW